MRIAHVVNVVDERGSYGGPLRVALNQVDELRRRGHDVTLLAGGAGFGDRSRLPGEFAGTPLRLFSAHQMVPGGGFAGSWAPGLQAHLLAAAGRGRRYDAVHVHLGRDLTTLPATAALRLTRTPYVVQTHGMIDSSQRRLAAPLDALLTRRALTVAQRVLVLTDRDAQDVDVVLRGRPWRRQQLPNGVAAPPPVPVSGQSTAEVSTVPEVLYLGRLHERKRPAAFVRIAGRAHALGVEARFTLVGADEGELSAVRAEMTRLPRGARVDYEGPTSMGGSLERLRQADVLVLPSDADTFPMVVLEAMSVGVPVVCMRSCGLADDIVRAGAGLVVPDGDDAAAAHAVQQLLGDPAFAARAGHAGRELVDRRFSIAAVAGALEQVYAQAAG